MNRSSLRKSFLDDLLGDSDSLSSPNVAGPSSDSRQQQQQQRTKSVRFLEGDDSGDTLGSLLPTSVSSSSSTPAASRVSSASEELLPSSGPRGGVTGAASSRSLSSGLEAGSRLRQEAAAEKAILGSATAAARPSDWLGLSEARQPVSPSFQWEGGADQVREEDVSSASLRNRREFVSRRLNRETKAGTLETYTRGCTADGDAIHRLDSDYLPSSTLFPLFFPDSVCLSPKPSFRCTRRE